jgi:PIN domain nuclease of toxin-antitoxin system
LQIELLDITGSTNIAMQQIFRDIVLDMPDRIITATAFDYNLPLISKDNKIQNLTNIQVIW